MTHLSVTQLLALREPASSPGTDGPRRHLEGCEVCQQELLRLHQRTARLKALPLLSPSRDRWPEIRSRLMARQRRRRMVWGGVGGVALAASVALALVFGRPSAVVDDGSVTRRDIATAMAQSRLLEEALGRYQPDRRVTDGRTATVVAGLEDRIAAVDRQLQLAEMMRREAGSPQLLSLWRQRVGLMDALVNVHLTRATNAGL